MNPEVWGPPAWTFLHSITLAYPDNPSDIDKSNYENFFNTLQPILPCAKCSQNYLRHLQEDPISNNLDNKKSLVNWLISVSVRNSNELYVSMIVGRTTFSLLDLNFDSVGTIIGFN